MPSPRKTSPSPRFSARSSFLNERSIGGPISLRPNYIRSTLHMRGQPKRDDRETDQDQEPNQVGDDERQHAFENSGEAHVLHDALDDEHDHPDGRVDEPEFHRHHDDDPEPDRGEPEMGDAGESEW